MSGPFVNEALRLVRSVDTELNRLVDDGFPVEAEAHKVHAALERLQAMLGREIDEAEAQQAAGERTFVFASCGAGVSPASKEQAGRLHHNSDKAPFTLELESEDDHDD